MNNKSRHWFFRALKFDFLCWEFPWILWIFQVSKKIFLKKLENFRQIIFENFNTYQEILEHFLVLYGTRTCGISKNKICLRRKIPRPKSFFKYHEEWKSFVQIHLRSYSSVDLCWFSSEDFWRKYLMKIFD